MSRNRILIFSLFAALLLTALFMGVASMAQAQGTILYVNRNAAGSNDGSSWTNAFTSLQGALAVANANPSNSYEVWVAKGVYTPSITRTASFSLTHNNAQLYGGFAATETLRTQRDWTANLTVLSGDNDGNDGVDANGVVTNTAAITGSNSYHVLYLDGVNNGPITGTTVIDGFTITAGKADGSSFPDNRGGGLFCAGNGSGKQCSPTLHNVTFSGNSAASSGGAIYNDGENGVSSPSLTNVTFSGNSAASSGGGMYNDGRGGGVSSPDLTNVVFSRNDAGSGGGGMYNNSRNSGASSPSLINVTFSGNSASSNGGGMYNDGRDSGKSSPSLTNVAFHGNDAGSNGGGLYNDGENGVSSPNLVNVTISGNAANKGGGIYNDGSNSGVSSPSLTNALLWENSGIGGGNQLYNLRATPALSYTLVPFVFDPLGESSNDIVNNNGSVIWGPGNITDTAAYVTADIFVNPGGGDLRLAVGSPAINTGDNAAINATGVTSDLAGNVRIQGGTVDMGAYEFELPTCPAVSPIYVNAAAGGSNRGDSWSNALTNLQTGLMLVRGCVSLDEIWVATGVYTPGMAVTNTFRLSSGVKLYGGFAATETLRTQRDWVANVTVLSGDVDGNDGMDAHGVVTTTTAITGSNSYHVLWLDGVVGDPITGTTVIDGFTITAGKARGEKPHNAGGGLYCAGEGSGNQCSPNLVNVIFSGNEAGANDDKGFNGGGGMFNNGGGGGISSPSLTNVTFSGNAVTGEKANGGGMYNSGEGGVSSPSLTNVTFRGNSALEKGGGMYNNGSLGGRSSPALTHVTFSGNSANDEQAAGGGMYNDGNGGVSSPILTDTNFINNRATKNGGGMYNDGSVSGVSSPTLTNVTFNGNSATGDEAAGGGMYNDGGVNGQSRPALTNTIFTNNRATEKGGGMYNAGGGVSSPILLNVIFSGNRADNLGGGMYNNGADGGASSPILLNVIFSGNRADNMGGGMYNNSAENGVSSPILLNVTFSGNLAGSNGGGGMLNFRGEGGVSNPTIRNSVFWNNRQESDVSSITNIDATPTVAYSLVEGCNPDGVWASACGTNGGHNLPDADPRFVTPVDPTTAPTTTGNLRLQAGSPAIDKGDNAAIPAGVTTDLDGAPRIVNGVVDLGAYERGGPKSVLYLPFVAR